MRTMHFIHLFQLNPQHTVPTLDDSGKVVWDSHAITTYLVNAYGQDDSLYPKDPYKRARIDQRLHFDTGVLFARLRDANYLIYNGGYEVPQAVIDSFYEAYDILEKFLKDGPYLVGDSLTIADLCTIPTVTSIVYHAPIDPNKYPKITEWIARVSELPYYEELSGQYVEQLATFLEEKKAAHKLQAK